MSTIYGLASGAVRAGVSVFRVSGPHAQAAWRRLTGNKAVPPPRRLVNVALFAENGALLDRALGACFAAPRSFTGEDVVEFHVHGAPAVQTALARALAACPHVRQAEPGEFTRRAWDNGKMDLVQVESLADLIAAETAAQRIQALRQMEGHLGRLYESWRGQLIRLLANVEAVIDFAEDDGIEEEVITASVEGAKAVSAEIRQHLDDGKRGERIRDGTRVAIVGPPNSGKSSLYNFLLGREAAIVTNVPGTTRDVLEASLDMNGYLVRLTDTAGIHHTDDIVELMGIGKARKEYESADVRLLVVDASQSPSDIVSLLEPFFEQAKKPSVIALNKSDLVDAATMTELSQRLKASFQVPVLSMSCAEKECEPLMQYLEETVEVSDAGDAPLLTRARHRALLEGALQKLEAFVATTGSVEMAAEELRAAVQDIAAISGHVTVDHDILGAIFSEFCIGK